MLGSFGTLSVAVREKEHLSLPNEGDWITEVELISGESYLSGCNIGIKICFLSLHLSLVRWLCLCPQQVWSSCSYTGYYHLIPYSNPTGKNVFLPPVFEKTFWASVWLGHFRSFVIDVMTMAMDGVMLVSLSLSTSNTPLTAGASVNFPWKLYGEEMGA